MEIIVMIIVMIVVNCNDCTELIFDKKEIVDPSKSITIDLPTKMVIFHGYISLPEGKFGTPRTTVYEMFMISITINV